MPLLSRWMVKLALLNLDLGFTLGGLLLANKGIPLHPTLWLLLPAHQEFLITGWMLNLAMEVAFWILPALPRNPNAVILGWPGLAGVLLNFGDMGDRD